MYYNLTYMFKYSSFRNFVKKFIIGVVLIIVSLLFLISLYSHSYSDPGFQTFNTKQSDIILSNYLGFFGAYLSSYTIIIIGHLSYFFGFYLLLEGVKSLLGINNKGFFVKAFSNILGIFLVDLFLISYGFEIFRHGLVSIFLSDLFEGLILLITSNNLIIYLIDLFLLILGILFIILSYSLRLIYLRKILVSFKILRYFKYLNFITPIFSILKRNVKNSKIKIKKNEPTIRRGSIINNKHRTNTINKFGKGGVSKFKFNLPNVNLLERTINKKVINKETDRLNTELAKKLELTLSDYGVEGKITGFKSGPIVTLFEFIPNAGIKSSKIIGLSDDIARAMSSISSRISSQPGKTSLGIEIPNSKRDSVLFGDLIDDDGFNIETESLTLALGKDISGLKIYASLEKMPHLLIAGTTGSGKSVGINTMILSILYKFKPNECKLILIDPKMLELSVYEDIPHLLTPVVTDPKKAVFALKWVVREMENRYKLMSSVNVKNIESYNNKVIKTISSGRKLFREVQTGIDGDTKMPIIEKIEIPLNKMPFIVVVIDEMADLMMVAGKEVESLVQRLAQMARASGIHLITATQRPSVDVITGTIKANFPSRISYKVASKFDSRTILNEMGAEQLLGSGDMLLLENGGNTKRLHGGFVSESEVEKVVNYIKNQATFDYKKEISFDAEDAAQRVDGDLISDNKDELYNKAVDIVVKQQKVSTSFIQRYLQIGYNRAARIVEKMEEDGIITEANNAGKRHVLKKD